MNLFELLKQFKSLEPDPRYTEQSKRAILATAQSFGTSIPAPRRVTLAAFHIAETAAAVVFAGLFLLLITGSMSHVGPVQLSVLNPNGLSAEAQAIDKMQIQLENLSYEESSAPAAAVSPRSAAALATPSSPSDVTSTPSSTLSVTDALQQLSE